MVKSMTGFGRGVSTCDAYILTVEIATVNRKQFDASIWLPREWMCFEVKLLGLLKTAIARGAVKCSVTIKPNGDTDSTTLLKERYQQVCSLAQQLNVTPQPTLSDLIALAATETNDIAFPEPTEAVWEVLQTATMMALGQLEAMRLHEGERIAADIRDRLTQLHALYQDIATIAPSLPARYREQLSKRIQELLPEGITLDEGHLEREVALFADRCDIAEELTRLKAHFAHAETLLCKDEPCGRALDFLCQEFFREINTTGSKCAGHTISSVVIAFKTLLETVREQVQNLE
ncbi:MAG: YicC family protein [Kiritimatiellae bacterium]|nr:YicC family protein [Kiritimatiellia bacterium]